MKSAMANDALIGGSVQVFRLFGVPIRLHFTFVLLLVFLLFIGIGEQQSSAGLAIYVLALFGSVLLHELGHALVARQFGIRTVEIVMFPIGGVSRPDRPPKVRHELWIALAGPAVNFLIAGLIAFWFWREQTLAPLAQLLTPTDTNLAQRIGVGNLILGAFNLLPAYPMDGGRVMRSLLARRIPENEATRITAMTGQGLAVAMGLFGLLSSNFMLVFVAMFVYLGAAQEGAMARGRILTVGFPARAAMVTDFRTLQHGDTIRDAGALLLATSQQDFPVMHGGAVVGLLTRAALIRSMLAQGPDAYVASAMDRNFVRVPPEMDLSEAFALTSGSCALVMDGDNLLGLLTAENFAEFLMLRQINLMQAKARD
jgi:Zn-dependent protease/CBS domain-containing protein